MGQACSPSQSQALLGYLELIREWGRAYNLVAAGDLDHLLERHLLDSLTILPWIGPGRLLDVGSGAGFPGVPVAVMRPEVDAVLLDAAGKKVRFLRHVVRSLDLTNARPVQARAESFSPGVEFSTITSRALGTLRAFAGSVRHLAGPDSRLLAMKGRRPDDELADLPDWVRAESVERLRVPGAAGGERHLVIMALTA